MTGMNISVDVCVDLILINVNISPKDWPTINKIKLCLKIQRIVFHLTMHMSYVINVFNNVE